MDSQTKRRRGNERNIQGIDENRFVEKMVKKMEGNLRRMDEDIVDEFDFQPNYKKSYKPSRKKKKDSKQQEVPRLKIIQTAKTKRSVFEDTMDNLWVFIISEGVSKEQKEKIDSLYNDVGEGQISSQSTLFSSVDEAKEILNTDKLNLKIVADLKNFKELCEQKTEECIEEFHVFSNKKTDIEEILKKTQQVSKLKGMVEHLDDVIERAEEEAEDQKMKQQFKKSGSELDKSYFRYYKKKLPSFLKLSGADKTVATKYRSTLYAGKNLPDDDRQASINLFLQEVKDRFKSNQQRTKIEEYLDIQSEDKARRKKVKGYLAKRVENPEYAQQLKKAWEKHTKSILRFYGDQSFYYDQVNNLLRKVREPDQFAFVQIGFNEMYHSISNFYTQYRSQNNEKIPSQTVYRGAKLTDKDFKALKKNVFIEMFGFMSTSKNQKEAKKFVNKKDKNKYLFVIHIPQLQIPPRLMKYDHGFVDMNRYEIPPEYFVAEEEVLFNALNVYRVSEVEEKENGWKYIHLEYGAIFDLLSKDAEKLSEDEREVLLNYEYCINLQKYIQFRGDAYMKCEKYQKAQQYFRQKVNQYKETKNKNLGTFYMKLSEALHARGKLDEAEEMAEKSLQIETMIMKELEEEDYKEKCYKVFGIHSKFAKINFDNEDFLQAEQHLEEAIEMMEQLSKVDENSQNLHKLAQQYIKMGRLKFQLGEAKNAEECFEKGEKLFQQLIKETEDNQWKEKKDYCYDCWYGCLLCPCKEDKRIERLAIKEKNLQGFQTFKTKLKEDREMLEYELLQVNSSLKQCHLYTDSKQKYEKCVKKGKHMVIESMGLSISDPIKKAKVKAVQATVQGYIQLAKSEQLLKEAIELVESVDPMAQDVGKYSTLLAEAQKAELEKFENPKVMAQMVQQFEEEKEEAQSEQEYQEETQKELVERCKQNYSKAITILLHHQKAESSGEVITIRNQIGQINLNEADFVGCEEVIQTVKQTAGDVAHTQVAKSRLLESKLTSCKGQMKTAFESIKTAFQILRQALVKEQNQRYEKIFRTSETFMELKYQQAKLYIKQLNHDQAIMSIRIIESSLKEKQVNIEAQSIYPQIEELKGEIEMSKRNYNTFPTFFERAIKIRIKQTGKFSFATATSYCNFANYLNLIGNRNEAKDNLEKAAKIFVSLPNGHPVIWPLYYYYGILLQKQSRKNHVNFVEYSLKLAEKKFDTTHIILKKIRMQYALALLKYKKYFESEEQFNILQNDLEVGIRQTRSKYEDGIDEKEKIRGNLIKSFKVNIQKLEESGEHNEELLKIKNLVESKNRFFG